MKENAIERHRRLIEDGWVRRFTAEEPRLSEMKQLYESLGLEVRIEDPTSDGDQECRSCLDVEAVTARYKTIFTRGKEAEDEGAGADDLFE